MIRSRSLMIWYITLSLAISPMLISNGSDDPTRSETGTHSSFLVQGEEMLDSTINISGLEGPGLVFERNEIEHLDDVNISHLSTFDMGNGRSVLKEDGIIYLAFIRENGTDWISFWLMLYYEEEGVWDIPVLVNNYSSAFVGKANLLVHDDKIFYMMQVEMSGGNNIIDVKWAPTSSWYGISGAELTNLDSSSEVTDMMDLVGHGQKVFAIWTRSTGSGYFARFDVANRVWNVPSVFPFNVEKIAAFSSDITGNQAIYVIYQGKGDFRLNISNSINDGAGWSTGQLISDSGNGFFSISAVECQGAVHVSLLYEDNNYLAYTRSEDCTNWEDLRTIRTFQDNGIDNVHSAQITGDRSQVVIAYEDGPGTVSTIISHDGGATFEDHRTYGGGQTHCPSLDLDKELLVMMNGTRLEVHRFALSGSAIISTIPLTSAGISSWKELGIEVAGLGDEGTIMYRVLSGVTKEQVHPVSGYENITGGSPGRIDGIRYDIVVEMTGDWTKGASLKDNIIIELHLCRDPDMQMTFLGMMVNFSTSFPMDLRLSGDHLVSSSENCDLTVGGVVLDSSYGSGYAVIGPVFADASWPDILGIDVSSNYAGSTAKVELLDVEMNPLPGFTLSESTQATNMGSVNFIKWGQNNLKDLPETVGVINIKVVLFAGTEGASPTLGSLELKYSGAPTIESVEYLQGVIFRGDRTGIVIHGSDPEDPEKDLDIQLFCTGPDGTRSNELISAPLWTGGQWVATFITDLAVPVGTYTFSAHLTDSCGMSSGTIPIEGGIEVLNNVPTPPSVHASPSYLRADSQLSVMVDRPGMDLETEAEGLTYNFSYYRGGELLLEAGSLSDRHDPEGLSFVKGDVLTVHVSTWDGLDLSEPAVLEIFVLNTGPIPLAALPERISFNEDEVSLTYNAADWFFDLDGDALTFEMNATENIRVSGGPTSFHLEADDDHRGEGSLMITAHDGEEGLTLKVPVTVSSVNDPPSLLIAGNVTVDQDSWAFIGISGYDRRDGEEVTVTSDIMEVIPDIEPGVDLFIYPNGSMLFRPTNDMVGTYTVIVTATDGMVNVTGELTLTVENVNKGPTKPLVEVDPDVRFIREGEMVAFSGTSEDEDLIWDDVLTFTWNSSIDGDLGKGARITPVLSIGEHTITLTVTDSSGISNVTSFTFEVKELETSRGEVMRTSVLLCIAAAVGFLIGTLLGFAIALARRKRRDEDVEKEEADDKKAPPLDGEPIEKERPDEDKPDAGEVPSDGNEKEDEADILDKKEDGPSGPSPNNKIQDPPF